MSGLTRCDQGIYQNSKQVEGLIHGSRVRIACSFGITERLLLPKYRPRFLYRQRANEVCQYVRPFVYSFGKSKQNEKATSHTHVNWSDSSQRSKFS
jgi:hypothetical protein